MADQNRRGAVERKTRETEIGVDIRLDGTGQADIATGLPFFDHMLELFAKHGKFDLEVKARGDLDVDGHHTVEDVGICLGQAVSQAVGKGSGIARFGSALLPMQEALAEAALDLCGRSYLVYNAPETAEKVGGFETQLTREFFLAWTANARATLHLNLRYGVNQHHIIEAIFKAFGRALDVATRLVGPTGNIPSTKGVL